MDILRLMDIVFQMAVLLVQMILQRALLEVISTIITENVLLVQVVALVVLTAIHVLNVDQNSISMEVYA